MNKTVNRIIVAVPLLGGLALLFYADNLLLWQAASLAGAAAAAKEWGKLSGLSDKESAIYAALFAVLCVAGALFFMPSPQDDSKGAADAVFTVAAVFWVVFAPLMLLAGRMLPGFVSRFAGMILLFAAWLAGSLLFAADTMLLLAAVLLVVIADAAAFFAGKTLGKTKMAPEVSPGKTWEGFCGGVFAVLIAAGVFASDITAQLPHIWILTAAFALTSISVVGDLFASLMKRNAGVKDSGAVLGAHGGVIDRLDAMLPVLPFAALLAGVLL